MVYGNSMFIFGGQHIQLYNTNEVFKFNFDKYEWEDVLVEGVKPEPIDSHCIVPYENKFISICGFLGESTRNYSNGVWEFDCSTCKWRELFKSTHDQDIVYFTRGIPQPRCQADCCIYSNKILMFGGTNGKRRFDDMWSFNLETLLWTQIICPFKEIPAVRLILNSAPSPPTRGPSPPCKISAAAASC